MQTASTLPIVLLALPAGALADLFDRRRLLIAVQVFLTGIGALLTTLTLTARSRLRTGAIRWGLFHDGERAGRLAEVYVVPSWDEHLRQHTGRLTGADRDTEERALALADGPAEVTHLLSVRH